MKPASRRQKGSRLERKVAALLRQKGFNACRMPLSGAFFALKGDIKCDDLDYHFECKNHEKARIWEWWQDVRDYRNPILCISSNHRPILAVVDIDTILNLLRIEKDHDSCLSRVSQETER